MRPLTGAEIRNRWIAFFEGKGHKYIPGVSLIPKDDPSLLWVNAGVTGLKKYFDGSEIPPSRRIVNVQKSIRTNDIENVGHTARHHTFFEMLGNFSIGDYFRDEVIAFAVEILTDEEKGFGMPLDKIYVTYNPSDLATKKRWMELGVAEDHLVPLEGNYWQIGEGPCGPNTEVFFDRGEKYDPDHLGVKLLQDDLENDRYIEIWGIVFSQYNAVNGVPRERYKELPSKNIDTGSGLERIACILQGTETNFETDLFMPIIKATEKLSGARYEDNKMAFRVIADHARCLTFALGDGAAFSNEGRGYVLRRIIRRAMRYGKKIGIHDAFMYKLISVVTEMYKGFYPELVKTLHSTENSVREEELRFLKTLETGEALLRSLLENKKEISGEEMFKLYDTYGFPPDLTKEIAAESGVSVDEAGFEAAMEEQRERARSARGEVESFHKQSKDLLAFDKESVFSYHDDVIEQAKVIGLFVDGVAVKELTGEGDIAFDLTPCYAEMGGQVTDHGEFVGKNAKGVILNVGKAPRGQHLHHAKVEGTLRLCDVVSLSIDIAKRRATERNHSATHLLHSALATVLGGHVAQKGSFVNEDYLRFDFGFNRKLTKEEIRAIEDIVNAKIFEGIEEVTEILPIEEAKKTGAEMEFSEKYGDYVRVVEFGDYSKEFCGGTHVKNTSEIGLFVIESEEAIAAGVRRIQARTSLGALKYLQSRTDLLDTAEESLFGGDVDFLVKLGKLKEELAGYKKETQLLKDKVSSLEAKSVSVEEVHGVTFYAAVKEGATRDALLSLSDTLKSNRSDYVFVLLGGQEGARPLLIVCGGKALEKFKAGDLVKEAALILQGGGGGRPEMASGQVKTKDGFASFADSVRGRL